MGVGCAAGVGGKKGEEMRKKEERKVGWAEEIGKKKERNGEKAGGPG